MAVFSNIVFILAALTVHPGRALGQTATVDAAVSLGTPAHLASGWIYGIPDAQGQIPDRFYTESGYRYGRAGGAQLHDEGQRGWIWGPSDYEGRFQSFLSNYHTTRKYGGRFQLLIHDLWGADGGQNSSAPYPGDNDDWTSYDEFLTALIDDIQSNSATEGLDIDIWNEPELEYFWGGRSTAQWLNLWGRTYHRLRDAFGPDVLLVGPSLSEAPSTTSSWWSQYLTFIRSNSSIPDQYTWHEEGESSDPQSSNATLKALLPQYDLPFRPNNVNEYAIAAYQVPSADAWFISRLERHETIGLRGNWASSTALHDFLAGLVGKPNAGTSAYDGTGTGYWPTGEFQVYRYYNLNQTGTRVGTTGSADNNFDVYATHDGSTLKILSGSKAQTGTWNITVTNLSSLGLPTSGSIDITTYEFGWNGQYGEVDAPTYKGQVTHTYANDEVTWWVEFSDANVAYAFEFGF
ncbi:predicted protein [Aspergillus terreus NIH2624]|uniref:Glycoside hydrolase family 39 protein n=1 Tax=Aspergillus terreus (strain NIH 2624 / FGSC A1156) TaxID=341663 RepID=Q0CYZ5_ASPTN|nr:uncharacterized protein ATEG_01089 [Aspergillus terreus NIH2624]EAU37846.1 predicted protein [Aspergillus terreus NIH2624]